MAYLELQNLYQEDIDKTTLTNLLEQEGLTYALILHNKDLDQEGQLKKPHYHCFIEIGYNPHKTTIQQAQETNLYNQLITKCTRLYLQPIKNIKAFTQYLIHKNEDNKYKYNIEDIQTNQPDYIQELINADLKDCKISNEDFLGKLEDYINGLTENYFTYLDIRQFAKQFKKLAYFMQYQSRIVEDLQLATGKAYYIKDIFYTQEEDK